MTLTPRQDVLLVAPDPLDEKLGSGLVRPASSKAPVRLGTVQRAGPGRWEGKRFFATEAGPGDRVAFFEANLETGEGKALSYALGGDGEHVLIRERDVLWCESPSEDKTDVD